MKEEFVGYLNSIGASSTIQERVLTVFEFYESVCPEKIADIFITDYITEDGLREFQNLWFFSESFVMEAKQFLAKDDFDMMPMKKRIIYWDIQKQDYDFKNFSEKSRFHLDFKVYPEMGGEFKASKENCDHLRQILLKYIVPNLRG